MSQDTWTGDDDYNPANPLEGKPVTFQVLMMASNGWLLASDTRMPEWLPGGRSYISSTRKLVHEPDANIAYGFSGDALAVTAGEVLMERARKSPMPPSFRYSELTVIGNEVLRRLAALPESARRTLADTRRLLIVFAAARNWGAQGWALDISNNGLVVPNLITSHSYGGAHPDALLFPQLFWKVGKTVQELLLLAAHTILTGARCNPSIIEGLDILASTATATGNKTRFLEPQELDDLRGKSDKLSQEFVRQLFAS